MKSSRHTVIPKGRNRAPHRAHLAAVGLLLLVPLVAAACGDSSDASSSKTSTTQSAADRASQQEAYRACLSRNGVNLPQGGQAGQTGDQAQGQAPSVPPQTIDQTAMQKAREACAKLEPKGGFGQGGGQRGQEFQAYLECLSQNGVDTSKLQRPGFGGGQNGQPPAGGNGTPGAPPTDANGAPPTGAAGTPPNGGPGSGFPGLDTSDPTVQKAMTACESKRPQFNPNGNGGQPGQNGTAPPANT